MNSERTHGISQRFMCVTSSTVTNLLYEFVLYGFIFLYVTFVEVHSIPCAPSPSYSLFGIGGPLEDIDQQVFVIGGRYIRGLKQLFLLGCVLFSVGIYMYIFMYSIAYPCNFFYHSFVSNHHVSTTNSWGLIKESQQQQAQ
ncbi:uncharacterized protein [Medicago truncatula]|uniref:uncharacterized protein n=1 Tax=Medicago truncatula TaxID=3880 RepID=UPI000D2F1C0A|nr:uncharacterized protein LOC112420856 [Medicago truncatula]